MSLYRSIVVLTGSGISADSGIPTFRDAGGMWQSYRIEDIASPESFKRNPSFVNRFYHDRRKQLLGLSIQPNPAHLALAKLEKEFEGEFFLVTQNIDNLHERAGSQKVMYMHGELLKLRCTRSDKVKTASADGDFEEKCDCCSPPSLLRPHVAWFGEMPFGLDEIYEALSSCDLFVAIGTSGVVYPAAGFVEEARAASAHTVEINLKSSDCAGLFDEGLYGPASRSVPDFVERILGKTT